jgi:lactate racemase
MRQVSLEYGGDILSLDVPDDSVVVGGVPTNQVRPPLKDPVAALREALDQPLGMEPLEQWIDKHSRIAITINDWMGGSYYAAPLVLDILRARNVEPQNIRIMIAGGTHAKVTRRQLCVSNMGRWKTGNKPPFAEAFRILPTDILETWSCPGNDRIERHDAADQDAMVNLGLTAYGDLVEVNKIVMESDVLIHLGWGPVPLSPWGGFLGGGLLGLSSAKSILCHHSPDVINHRDSVHSDPKRQLYAHHKNAFMEKVEGAAKAKVFLIDPYFNSQGQFSGRWWTGHWRKLREAQIAFALQEFTVKIPRSADILILDCPPWMFHGGTDNPLLAMSFVAATMRAYLPPNPLLRKNGVVICLTPCDGTIDEWYRPSDREAMALYARVGNDVGELFDRYSEDFLIRPEYIYKYRFCYGHHPIHAFWLLAAEQYAFDQTSKIIFAGARDSEPLRQMRITPVPDLRAAWDLAVKTIGKQQPDVTVLPHCSKRMGVIFDVAEG